MKTSNKILLSFFLFIFIGITALYIGSKYYAEYYDTPNLIDDVKPLPHFSVVVVESGAFIQLNNGTERKIVQTAYKEPQPKFAPFVVRNDTLFVFSPKQSSNKFPKYKFFVNIFCENIKSIVTKENSTIRMEKFQADTLSVIMYKSNLDWRFQNVRYLSVQAKDSEIYLEGEKLGKLAIKLDKTRINSSIKKRTDILSGSLINVSDLRFSMSNTVTLDADNTSNYDFYNLGN